MDHGHPAAAEGSLGLDAGELAPVLVDEDAVAAGIELVDADRGARGQGTKARLGAVALAAGRSCHQITIVLHVVAPPPPVQAYPARAPRRPAIAPASSPSAGTSAPGQQHRLAHPRAGADRAPGPITSGPSSRAPAPIRGALAASRTGPLELDLVADRVAGLGGGAQHRPPARRRPRR